MTIEKPCGFKFQIHGVTYPNVDTDSFAINKKFSLLTSKKTISKHCSCSEPQSYEEIPTHEDLVSA